MAIISEEPVITRLDRLDNMLRQLEEMKGGNRSGRSSSTSCGSGTEGHPHPSISSVDLIISVSPTPTSLEKHCRPIDHVMMETQVKGSLIHRLDQAEERLLKLCLQLEEELEAEKKRELDNHQNVNKPRKKGIKQFVKQCVKGKHK